MIIPDPERVTSPEPRSEALQVPLRRPRFFTPWVMVGLMLAALVPGWWASARQQAGEALPSDWATSLSLLLAGVVLVIRALSRPQRVPPIVLDDHGMELPMGPGARRARRVPYADILSIHTFGVGERARLVIGTARQGIAVFPVTAFEHPEAAHYLGPYVRQRIARQPEGRRLLREMYEREQLGRRAWAQRPVVVQVLLALIALVYIAQDLSGALEDRGALLAMGANSAPLVAAGQWWRLATCNFLHGGLAHVTLNGLALYSLGSLLERLIGPWRFTVLYLLSALGGAWASYLFTTGLLAVGASTAVFGLLGGLAVISARFSRQLPGGMRQSRRWWLVILGINGALPVLVPQIDVAAHVGGFLAGALVTLALCRAPAHVQPGRPAGALVKALALALCGVFVASAALALSRDEGAREADERRFLAYMAEAPEVDPRALNEWAWFRAIDPQATQEELRTAARFAARAVENAPRHGLEPNGAFRDTWATALYRLGDTRRAVELELEALALRGSPVFKAQLARFLAAHLRAHGPLVLAGEGPPVRARVEAQGDDRALVLEMGCTGPGGATHYLVGEDQGRLLGLLRVDFGPGRHCGPVRLSGGWIPSGQPRWVKARWQVAASDYRRCRPPAAGEPDPCAPGQRSVSAAPLVPEVAALP